MLQLDNFVSRSTDLYHASTQEKRPDGKVCKNPNVLISLAKPTELVALVSFIDFLTCNCDPLGAS